MADIVVGVIWYRVLADRGMPLPELTDELVTALTGIS